MHSSFFGLQATSQFNTLSSRCHQTHKVSFASPSCGRPRCQSSSRLSSNLDQCLPITSYGQHNTCASWAVLQVSLTEFERRSSHRRLEVQSPGPGDHQSRRNTSSSRHLLPGKHESSKVRMLVHTVEVAKAPRDASLIC